MPNNQGTLFTLESTDTVTEAIIDQIKSPTVEPTITEIEVAINILQHHLEKEARNRSLPMLAPEDLCPAQKRELVRDLTRLLR